MIIYHGSKNIIKKPEYGKGNKFNDYGLGFYCTEDIELAKEWACSNRDINGFANKYEIDINKYKVLNLCDEKYSVLNWIAVLLKFRTFDIKSPIAKAAKKYLLDNFYIDVEKYDIIIGYRADDSYFSFAKDFIENKITLEQLSVAMQLGVLGNQIVLKSEKVFNEIIYLESEIAESNYYFIKKYVRDEFARTEYFENLKYNIIPDGIFMIDIIRKGSKNGDRIL